MISTLCLLTIEDLSQLANALHSGRLAPPFTSLHLRRYRHSCRPLISLRLPRQKTLRRACCYGLPPSLAASRIISKHLQSTAHFILCHYDLVTANVGQASDSCSFYRCC